MKGRDDEQPVEIEIEIDAPPEEVFALLSEADRLSTWIGQRVLFDPRPDGDVLIDVNGRDRVRGKVVAIDPPRFIAFSWGWDREGTNMPPGSSLIEITLQRSGDGTRLRLRHSGLPSDVRDEHAAGWQHYLGRLRTAAGGEDPGPDPLATTRIEHGVPGSYPADVLDESTDGRD